MLWAQLAPSHLGMLLGIGVANAVTLAVGKLVLLRAARHKPASAISADPSGPDGRHDAEMAYKEDSSARTEKATQNLILLPIESTNELQPIDHVRIYPGADCDFALYADDGNTYAYEHRDYRLTHRHWDDKTRQLTKTGAEAWGASSTDVIEIVGNPNM